MKETTQHTEATEVPKPAEPIDPSQVSKPEEASEETKIDEMLRFIENIDDEIEKHKNFDEINSKITGVPVRFVLVPVKNFIKSFKNSKINKLEGKEGEGISLYTYVKIPDKILSEYSTMLNHILDFRQENCIRDRVFEGYRESGNIVFNKNSQISHLIAFE